MKYKYLIKDLYDSIMKNNTHDFLYFTVNIEPYSKSNNLFYGNRNAYVPKRFKENDKIVISSTKDYLKSSKKTKLSGPLIMQIDGYYSTKRVVDAQNLSKSICDALNDIVYYDDRQIIFCTTTKSYDKNNPRIEIFIMKINEDHDMVNMVPLLTPKSVKAAKSTTKLKAVVSGPRKVKSGTTKHIKKQKKK